MGLRSFERKRGPRHSLGYLDPEATRWALRSERLGDPEGDGWGAAGGAVRHWSPQRRFGTKRGSCAQDARGVSLVSSTVESGESHPGRGRARRQGGRVRAAALGFRGPARPWSRGREGSALSARLSYLVVTLSNNQTTSV